MPKSHVPLLPLLLLLAGCGSAPGVVEPGLRPPSAVGAAAGFRAAVFSFFFFAVTTSSMLICLYPKVFSGGRVLLSLLRVGECSKRN
jgi:hypothetical protein